MNNKADINIVWNAVAPILKKFKFYDIKDIVGLAGFNGKVLANFTYQDTWGNEDLNSDKLVSDIGQYFFDFSDEEKRRFLNIVIEEILSFQYDAKDIYPYLLEERLQEYLNRLGWQPIDKKVLPIEVLDLSDLNELDPTAQEELVKAATKFRDGDLSGAILSSYSAVENVISKIYKENDLGVIDYNKSFQNRCKKAFEATGVYAAIDSQLDDIDWKKGNIKDFKTNLEGSVNHAAFVLQLLRNNMAGIHGTKPVIKPLVFDSIKWAQIIYL